MYIVCINKNLRRLNEQVKRLLSMTHDRFHVYDFQVWLQCWRYHYYLLIWPCLSNCDNRSLYAYIKPHWNDVFLWTLLKIQELYSILGWKILHKRTGSGDPLAIHPKMCGNFLPRKNLYIRQSREIPAL